MIRQKQDTGHAGCLDSGTRCQEEQKLTQHGGNAPIEFKEYDIKEYQKARIFYFGSVDEEECLWHMDKKTRQVLVLSHGGWKFQLDGELPQDLYNGKVFTIEKKHFIEL